MLGTAAEPARALELYGSEVAMIPLDSRPVNTYFPRMVGEMGGVDVNLPPDDLMDHFTRPGDGEGMGEWLLRQRADGYVVSISMLAYGGLIASRTGEMPLAEAKQHIEVLRELNAKHPDRPIYAYDMIQRLAITATGDGNDAYYSLIQRWAVLKDLVSNLGRTGYADQLQSLERRIPASVLDDYKRARRRNHAINLYMLDLVKEGVIDYLVFAQDDAAPYGLHRAEREALQAKVEGLHLADRVMFFNGADEVDMVLLARFMTERTGIHPAFTVAYPEASDADWVAHLEDLPISENVRRHILAAGGGIVSAEGSMSERPSHHDAGDPATAGRIGADRAPSGWIRADDRPIALMVNTPSGQDEEFAGRVRRLLDAGRPVAVADVAVANRVDRGFFWELEDAVQFPELIAFSGWNTAGNTLGIVIGQSIARTIGLTTLDGPQALMATRAWANFLFARVVTDEAYKLRVRPAAIRFARRRGLNPRHLAETEAVDDYVSERMIDEAWELFRERFEEVEIPITDERVGTIWKLIELRTGLVWPRLFEVEIEPALAILDMPSF